MVSGYCVQYGEQLTHAGGQCQVGCAHLPSQSPRSSNRAVMAIPIVIRSHLAVCTRYRQRRPIVQNHGMLEHRDLGPTADCLANSREPHLCKIHWWGRLRHGLPAAPPPVNAPPPKLGSCQA
jgi:hypothetical protein